MDLPMLIEETAQDAKILNAIIALEAGKLDGIFTHTARTANILKTASEYYFTTIVSLFQKR